jgi:hypothetical protein
MQGVKQALITTGSRMIATFFVMARTDAYEAEKNTA